MDCENDFLAVTPVEPDRLRAVLEYFESLGPLTSTYNGKPISKGLLLSIIALSGPETGYRWNEFRRNAVIFANGDGQPDCAECCTPVGIEWSGTTYRRSMKSTTPTGAAILSKGYAIEDGGMLTRRGQANEPQATRFVFETCVQYRDEAVLDNFSVGPTQMWMGQGQGRIHILGGAEVNWDRLWAYYTGTASNSASAAALYLDRKPYPFDQPSPDNVISWLRAQTGSTAGIAESYYSGNQNYKDYLSRVSSMARQYAYWNA